MLFSNAMPTNHLRAPYGVYFTNDRTILRRPYGARPAAGRIVRFLFYIFKTSYVCKHRTGTGRFLFKHLSYDSNGARLDIVRCLTSAKNIKKSLNKSADARPGTGRCPSGHRPMFYESNCHR